VYAERSIETPAFGVGLSTPDVTPLHTIRSLPVHTIDDVVMEFSGLLPAATAVHVRLAGS
jgi:hypothetical protein